MNRQILQPFAIRTLIERFHASDVKFHASEVAQKCHWPELVVPPIVMTGNANRILRKLQAMRNFAKHGDTYSILGAQTHVGASLKVPDETATKPRGVFSNLNWRVCD